MDNSEVVQNEALKIEADLAVRQAQAERESVNGIVVTTPDDYRLAVATLKELAAKYRNLTKRRQEATKPLDAAKAAIMGWFRPAVDELELCLSQLRRQIAAYEDHQRKLEAEASADHVAAIAAGKAPDMAKLARAFSGAVSGEGVTVKHPWDFEVTDPDAVPREYLKIDEQKIRLVVRALKERTAIPGVRVFKTTQIAVAGGGQ